MEGREDLTSILPYLPVVVRSSSIFWPSQVVEALKTLSIGPHHSSVNSGELLFVAISDLRNSLSLLPLSLSPFTPNGYALFFDELISRAESEKWFGGVVPALANLLLRLPALLESHYQNADALVSEGKFGVKTSLRLLGPQQSGIVFLSQELIGALLACSLFCLFPVTNRGANHLPMINFDELFACLYERYSENQEHKIKCIIHYFERICSHMPIGSVSFERKVLPLELSPFCVSCAETDFWSKSAVALCPFEVQSSGMIEDQSKEALEVDFANKYIGGGALHRGCVQEEIRFMINPELIAGMLFLPSMADNEAIEIVGPERFSNYIGYASSFGFAGDYKDQKNVDIFGRRKTRIIAIDAVNNPGMRQYKLEYLLREINKAFCGFVNQSNYHQSGRLFQDNERQGAYINQDDKSDEAGSASVEMDEGESLNRKVRKSEKGSQSLDHEDSIGIVTGNWGCGAFGGDPELKTIIQWLAASQALRPFISYYTCDIEALRHLDQVTQWILSHEWTVGDLWNMLVEYSSQRLKGETNVGFFTWLLPSRIAHRG